jgi:hypothetical protein
MVQTEDAIRMPSARCRGTAAHESASNGNLHPGGVEGSLVFAALKVLSYVAHAAMAASIVYAGVLAIRYWPGIGV